MTITVVIPAYNAGRYIERAVDSVLAQSVPADEIIVVDDGSTDNTADIVSGYGSKVRYIHQQNAGASVARNTAVEAATSHWIAFLDADDEWLADKLRLQKEHLKRNSELVWTTGNFIRCYCDQDRRKDDLTGRRLQGAKELLGDKEYFDSYFAAYAAFAAGHTDTMLIKRDVLIEAGLFLPGQLRINDVDMWFKIAYRHRQIGFLSEPLAIYHLAVPDSIIKSYKDPAIIREFTQRHLALAAQYNCLDQFTPCAAKMLGWWIACRLNEKKGKDVRNLLCDYGYLFKPYCRITTYIRAMFPGTAAFYEKIKKRIAK
jgi:glycosyltransferase involved in cell wall biosynthesis